MVFNGIWHVLTRRKVLDSASIQETKLSKCLGTGDLTALGVGSTLGIGIYVLGGHVARDIAGPSVILSFLIAAIASVFAGLCYAEFGARVPRAGSAYIYSYVCVGEFIAFIIGWNLILEYVIGSASVSRGVSLYLDSILNNTLKESFREITPVMLTNVTDYFDLLAFGLSVFVGVSLAFGLKYSSIVNNIFTILNICVVIFIIGGGAFHVSIDNWFLPKENSSIPENYGDGGFFPYGLVGTLKGAATCFFGFVGFDCISSTGEEVRNPRKAIPLSIILTLSIVFFSYFGVSAILTLMSPYYELHEDSPIPFAFEYNGWVWAKWIIAIGGIFGMISSLFGAMYPLPRILYAMASDGLIFRFLGIVNATYKSPIIGTIIAALLTGTMAGLLELQHLINMMSIGTLMAYTIVAACIVLLRYKCNSRVVCDTDESYSLLPKDDTDEENDVDCDDKQFNRVDSLNSIREVDNEEYQEDILMPDPIGSVENLESTNLIHRKFNYSIGEIVKQLFNCNRSGNPTNLSSNIVGVLITLYCLFSLACGLCIKFMWEDLGNGKVASVVVTSIFGGLMLISLLFTALQPSSNYVLSFKVPLVPLIPFISIFFNIYLMLMLDPYTWIRFGVWMAIGIPIYIASLWIYGRGTNYIPHAQKFSVNGSSLYGIDSMVECKERTFMNYENMDEIVFPKMIMDSNENLKIENLNRNTFPFTNELLNENSDEIDNNAPIIESVNSAISNDAVILDAGPISPNVSVVDYEEIELLDKVLKDAEEESMDCSCIDMTDSINTTDEVLQTSSLAETNTNNAVFEPDKTVTQNVVALVHREDDNNEKTAENPAPESNDDNTDVEIIAHEVSVVQLSEENADKTPDESNVIKIDVVNDEVPPEPEIEIPKENPPSLKISIPVPPPLNESYFTSPKPFVKNKSLKIISPNKNNDKVHIKSDKDVNDNDSDDPKTDIIEKLNIIFGGNNRSLQRGMSVNPRIHPISFSKNEMHKSEPDIQALIKREASNAPALSSVEINESLNIEKDKISIAIKPSVVHVPYSKKDNVDSQNNNGITINVKGEDDQKIEEDKPPTKEDIKKKLEALLARSPNIKEIKLNDTVDDDRKSRNEIKPKQNFSNTMKIKRALFDDVLKSLNENSRRGSTDGEPHGLKKTQSFAKSDILTNSNDVR